MEKIFVVVAFVDYESSDSIKAFKSEKMALKFADELRAYQDSKPRFHDQYDELVSDQIESWEKAHPGGYLCRNADGFRVEESGLDEEVPA